MRKINNELVCLSVLSDPHLWLSALSPMVALLKIKFFKQVTNIQTDLFISEEVVFCSETTFHQWIITKLLNITI